MINMQSEKKLTVFTSDKFGKLRTMVNDDGSISINAEDVAGGLGWITVAKSGNEVIRWNRVNSYCKEFGFEKPITKDDYIPESLFYLLGMKANSSAAKEFQKWIALEVLPQIRMKGQYSINNNSMTELNTVNNNSINNDDNISSSLNALQTQLSPEIRAILCIDNRTVEMKEKVSNLENNMTIDYSQQEELRNIAVKSVFKALGGKNTPAYKELGKKTFASIWSDYKRILNVNSYRNTAVVKFEYAKSILESWCPSRELELMIMGANSR